MNNKPAVPQFQIPEWLRPHVAEVRAWPRPSTPRVLCKVDGCQRDRRALGLCGHHYDRARIHAGRAGVSASEWVADGGIASGRLRPIATPARACWVIACDRNSHHSGLCKPHFGLARHHFRTGSGGSDEAGVSST